MHAYVAGMRVFPQNRNAIPIRQPHGAGNRWIAVVGIWSNADLHAGSETLWITGVTLLRGVMTG